MPWIIKSERGRRALHSLWWNYYYWYDDLRLIIYIRRLLELIMINNIIYVLLLLIVLMNINKMYIAEYRRATCIINHRISQQRRQAVSSNCHPRHWVMQRLLQQLPNSTSTRMPRRRPQQQQLLLHHILDQRHPIQILLRLHLIHTLPVLPRPVRLYFL